MIKGAPFDNLTFGSTFTTQCAGRYEAMWIMISHGKDNKSLDSADGDRIASAGGEPREDGRLKGNGEQTK